MSERLLTAREVAGQIGISTTVVLKWARAGLMPSVKLPGGAVRFEPVEITEWLARCRRGGATERGVSATHPSRAQDGAYAPILLSSSATRSKTAENEEDIDAC
jgi:excisionase family DNA binding protein